MAIDPSIALGYKGIEAPNPLAQYAQVSQIQNAQNQNALNQYQLAAAKRADELTNATNELYSRYYNPATGAVDQNALYKELATKGLGAQIPVMQAKLADTEHKAYTAQKAKIDAAAEERKFVEGAQRNLSANPSDANITAWLEDARLSNTLSTQTKAQLEREAAKLLAMKPAQRAEYLSMQGATSGDITSRGQLKVSQGQLKVAQDRLAQDAQAVTYQTDANGNIVAVPTKIAPGTVAKAIPIAAPGAGMEPLKAKDASKTAVSEQQASYNIGRVLNAAKEISKIVEKNPSVVKPGAGEALASSVGLSGTANFARNADRQIVYGAQRDALDALLYLATGAAYNKEQLEGQMAAYIPSYTDEPAAVAAKQTRMAELIQSAKTRAGKAWTPEMESAMQNLIKPGAAAAGVDSSNPLLK